MSLPVCKFRHLRCFWAGYTQISVCILQWTTTLCRLCAYLLLGTLICLVIVKLSRLVRKPTIWFPNRSDTSQAVQPQKLARSLKFRTIEEEEVYYQCSENKDADQRLGNREADLRVCFRICRLLVFS